MLLRIDDVVSGFKKKVEKKGRICTITRSIRNFWRLKRWVKKEIKKKKNSLKTF